MSGSTFFKPPALPVVADSVRSRVNLPEALEVPVRPIFSTNPVGSLEISNSEEGVRLRLRISGDLNEDVVVFGQEPCSSGRRKRRNVAYLGLLPPPIDGLSDITDLYQARYGEARPGTRVFIVTCQQANGWKGLDREASTLVPDRPKGQQATAEAADSQYLLMHKGSTRDAEGIIPSVASQLPEGSETAEGGEKAAESAFDRSGLAGGCLDDPG